MYFKCIYLVSMKQKTNKKKKIMCLVYKQNKTSGKLFCAQFKPLWWNSTYTCI